MAAGVSDRVVIVGGGITGLAAAYHLQHKAGFKKIMLLEGSARLGGRIFTERQEGFVMEHGADVFVTRRPHARELCHRLGLAPQPSLLHKAYLRDADGLHPMPEGFTGLVPSRIGALIRSPLLSLRGKARLLMEPLVSRRRHEQEESIQSFFVRRFGREVYDQVIAPLVGGLSGGDPATLSLDAQLPHLRALEQRHGSLLWAMLGRSKSSGSALASLSGGLGALVDTLVAKLDVVDIRMSWPVRSVRRKESGYVVERRDGRISEADKVIVAAPAYAAAPMLALLDGQLSDLLGTIRYGAAIIVHLGFKASSVPRPLDASGYIALSGTGQEVVASTWSSAKFSGRAPADHVLLRIISGRKRSDATFAMDDSQLVATARSEIRETMGIEALPVLWRVHRWPHSVPRYVLGHRQRCAHIMERLQEYPGLHLAGAAYDGAGIPDCIKSGQNVAEAVIKG